MIGRGRASGAITFLNALFTGTGAAAGIRLYSNARVELQTAPETSLSFREPGSDTPIVRATIEEVLHEWSAGRHWTVTASISSAVPPGAGLKSSSAVAVAIARATCAALGRDTSNDELARICAEVAQRIGLSATGAFDDCLAASEPGIHVTDNPSRRRVRTDPVDPGWRVLVAVPTGRHSPSSEHLERFRRERSAASHAEAAARRGDFLEAMRANTALVERLMGYRVESTRAKLVEAGALGSGVSGMGPAMAAIVGAGQVGPVRSVLQAFAPTVLVSEFSDGIASSAGVDA